MSNDVLNSRNTQMIQAMDRHGITLDRLIDQLQDELTAEDTKFFSDKGVVIEEKQVAAHDVRQRARIDAHKLRGDYPATGVNVQASGEHTVKIMRFSDDESKA